jgi:hypothetical protein
MDIVWETVQMIDRKPEEVTQNWNPNPNPEASQRLTCNDFEKTLKCALRTQRFR